MKDMRILIIGMNGMLGNCAFKYFTEKGYFCRGTSTSGEGESIMLNIDEQYQHVGKLIEILKLYNISHILNATGNLKKNSSNKEDLKKIFFINSIFPKVLSSITEQRNIQLVHISTNGVFSGAGPFSNTDNPLPDTDYGMSKLLGECINKNTITIRTSIIGYHPNQKKGILGWFLDHKDGDTISGYSQVLWNGITTLTLVKIIDRIWKDKIPINSILHIANETLSKYALLELLKKIYNKKEYIITSSDEQRENITLIASIEQEQFSNQIPILEKQIIELKEFYS